MKTYYNTTSGNIFGDYESLDSLARDASYKDFEDMKKQLGSDSKDIQALEGEN